jgi:serine/threonine-protein kinase
LAGEFHHPNIVQVYDLGESEGSFYMVMEWLDGESLAARLERVGRMSFAEVNTCLVPCMHAIQRAHDCGIVHRDIKPANIFLCDATADRPALCKVLDFGISKRITAGADMSSFVTKTGMLIGTPHYLAPEQLRSRPVDRRTDIYGFGVLLYETLAGELPYNADNFGDLVVEISVGTPRSLRALVPDLPVGVEQVVARAMAREPEQRYQSLHELIASLQAIDPTPLTAATLPQIDAPSSLPPIVTMARDSAQLGGSRRRQLLAVAAAASVLTAAVGFMVFQRDPQATDEPSAIVRPRALPTAAPLDVASDVSVRHSASPLPQLDAAMDSDQPIPLDPVKAAEPKNIQATQPRDLAKAVGPKNAESPKSAEQKSAASAKSDPVRSAEQAAAAPLTSAAEQHSAQAKTAASLKLLAQDKPIEPQASKPKTATQGSATLKPAALEPLDQAPPIAAPTPAQPAPNARAPEHNPLHMNIQ